jgi:hypothetical protein
MKLVCARRDTPALAQAVRWSDELSRTVMALSRALLLLSWAMLVLAQFEPDFRADAPVWQAKIREDVLAQYDKLVLPISYRNSTGNAYSDSGTDVDMQVRFFKVQDVSAMQGSMRLKVWMRMVWTDTRLAWN